MTLRLFPSDPEPFALTERGRAQSVAVRSVVSADLADADVARRQADAVADVLEGAGHQPRTRVEETVAAQSTGSAVVVCVDCEHGVVAADELGEPGRPAETVGRTAAEAAFGALDGPGAVDEHLADQLLLPLVLAGGTLSVPSLTEHVSTSLDLLEQFGYDVVVDADAGDDSGARLTVSK